MKFLLINYIILTILSTDKIIGIWKSIDNNSIKYLDFKVDGNLLQIEEEKTSRMTFKIVDNYLEFTNDNNSSEKIFKLDGDTLVIQSILNGNIIKNKFVKERLAL